MQLDGSTADYHLLRANLLESSQDLANAISEYRRVLAWRPGDPVAASNLTVCVDLVRQNGRAAPLKPEIQKQLLAALREQRRLVEAGPLSALIEPDAVIAEASLRARLKEYQKQIGWENGRILRNDDGTFNVTLDNLALGDLSVLKDQPVSGLSLNYTGISDLSVLKGMHLKRLSLNFTKVADLGPLYGMRLESLEIAGLSVYDITPLVGMPLRHLNLNRTQVYEIATLTGMPIEYFTASNTRLTDISPLTGAPLSYVDLSASHVTDLTPLAHSSVKSLDVSLNQIGDLRALSSCTQLERLYLSHTLVYDLSPLAGLHLRDMDASNTNIVSVTPLAGQPLHTVRLDHTYVSDLAPLASCTSLEEIVLPPKAKNIDSLRQLPLKYISRDYAGNRPTQTANQFWKTQDSTPSDRIPR